MVTAGGRVVKNVAGYDMTRLITGSAGTLGFISEATWRVSTIPDRCAAITATGSLDACRSAALEIVQSKLAPIYVTCLAGSQTLTDKVSGEWKIVVGFEGFSKTVDYQLKKCGAVMENNKLQSLVTDDYPVHAGKFADVYHAIGELPYILRANFSLDQVAGFVTALDNSLKMSEVFLDLGCGRLLGGLDDMRDDDWKRVCELIDQRDGHGLLMKAPDDFRKRNDVFGTPKSEWKVMHRIKAALDPDNIFSPGCLPGKV